MRYKTHSSHVNGFDRRTVAALASLTESQVRRLSEETAELPFAASQMTECEITCVLRALDCIVRVAERRKEELTRTLLTGEVPPIADWGLEFPSATGEDFSEISSLVPTVSDR